MPARSDKGTFYTHNDLQLNGKTVRNWSFLWDAGNKVSLWVAYPLYASIIGSGDRSDAWGFDPLLSTSAQPDVTTTYTGSATYARGHQLPSADRLCSYEANVSTFYSTNMTPQCHDFNNNLWAQLESQVRYWARGCDTLYVVTGCIVDGSDRYTTDRSYNQMRITVPTHYYKALLRLKSGSYTSCAYIYDHFAYLDGTLSADTFDAEDRVSVAEVESRTGMTFFANLSAKVGESQAQLIKATASSW